MRLGPLEAATARRVLAAVDTVEEVGNDAGSGSADSRVSTDSIESNESAATAGDAASAGEAYAAEVAEAVATVVTLPAVAMAAAAAAATPAERSGEMLASLCGALARIGELSRCERAARLSGRCMLVASNWRCSCSTRLSVAPVRE